MHQSTGLSPSDKAPGDPRPAKPSERFPLFPHRVGQWAKSIRGKTHYFGCWGRRVNGQWVRVAGDGWKAALACYEEQRADLEAGRTPKRREGALTIRDLANKFLTHAERRVKSGELAQRSFDDYKRTCDRLVRVFGLTAAVPELDPTDFARLRDSISETSGPVTLSNEIVRAKVVFNFAYKNRLIPQPPFFGMEFKKPSKQVLRKVRAAKPKKLLTAVQCRELIEKAPTPELKAMILLGLNGGFGNADCAQLPKSAADLKCSWIDFPRPKSGISRRFPLWPETKVALEEVLRRRQQDRELVFVTAKGNSYDKHPTAITQEFKKLLQVLGLHQAGWGFYLLRHQFRTIADSCRDRVAIDCVMGHADHSVADHYREHIEDERLRAVVNHVHNWLFGPPVCYGGNGNG